MYFLIGRLFAAPATHVQAWRLAAWVASAVVFAMHIGYEHFARRGMPRSIALHTSAGVGIGALALAVAGMVHSLSTGAGIRPLWLVALVAWPALTAIPAFIVALVAAVVLVRLSRR